MSNFSASNFIIKGLPTILGTLKASKYFPSTEFLINKKIPRFSETDTPISIIRQTIKSEKLNDFFSGQIINDHCFLLAEIYFSPEDKEKADKFSFHSVITENYTLQECFKSCCRDLKWFYYRLDFNSKTSGLFKENIPHLHTRLGGVPRFYFPLCYEFNPLIVFLDFIYRTHFYEEWFNFITSIFNDRIVISKDLMDILTSPIWPSYITAKELNSKFPEDIGKIKDCLTTHMKESSKKFFYSDKTFQQMNHPNI